jgi:hypothetical protein
VELDHGDLAVVGDREHASAGVGSADPEVVHPACSAEADVAAGIEPVVAQPVVPWGLGLAGRALGVAR